ncbi:MAG TPA: DUF5658 family protein [Steroidobacteraceae bacterium]|nr:DUF5658 family protein [Steroidobacteraceae bacterium]
MNGEVGGDAVRATRRAVTQSPAVSQAHAADRRGSDRRQRTLHALIYGSFHPRRRQPRRAGEAILSGIDWHAPQWLAIAVLIVVLSCVDAALTLALLQLGAYEVNPVMAALVGSSAAAFTAVKVGLTGGGVVLLTLLARMRAFGKIPVGLILYLVLLGYGVLVMYEVHLLDQTPRPF